MTSTMKKTYICGLLLLLLNVAQGFAQQVTDFEWDVYNSEAYITGYVGTSSDVVILEVINGMPVTSIGEAAFSGKQLTSVTIPSSIRAIDFYAFEYNCLTGVIIPDGVWAIGQGAFQNNQLTSITIPDSVTWIRGSAFAGNQLTSITIPPGATIESYAFKSNPITSITIGADVSFMPEGRILNSILGGRFEGSFDQLYENGGRLAGTYTRPNPESTVWTRED